METVRAGFVWRRPRGSDPVAGAFLKGGAIVAPSRLAAMFEGFGVPPRPTHHRGRPGTGDGGHAREGQEGRSAARRARRRLLIGSFQERSLMERSGNSDGPVPATIPEGAMMLGATATKAAAITGRRMVNGQQ